MSAPSAPAGDNSPRLSDADLTLAAQTSSTSGGWSQHGARRSESFPPGTVILNEYLIERLLGEGGMGSVYLAREVSTRNRFAIKRIRPDLLSESRVRRSFLRELQMWLSLPSHPHLTECCFFRSSGAEILIFAEYVAGGSLKDWISSGRIASPAMAIDLAIQMAWGLSAAHAQGVVHQDVKPGNVLLTPDGLVKITDFGLARSLAAPAEASHPLIAETAMLSGQAAAGVLGMTRAFCSPEQAAGLPLSHHTDTWSWGLTVLAMFTGGARWLSGTAAATSLELCVSGQGEQDGLAMTPAIASVLRRCFAVAPDDRWPALDLAAAALVNSHNELTGAVYPRTNPWTARTTIRISTTATLRIHDEMRWEDPRPLLREVLRITDAAASVYGDLLSEPLGSRRAWIAADLAVCDEIRQLLEPLVASGYQPARRLFGRALACQGTLLMAAGDRGGAIIDLSEAINFLRYNDDASRALEQLITVANLYVILERAADQSELGITACDEAIALLEQVYHQFPDPSVALKLGQTYARKARRIIDPTAKQEQLRLLDTSLSYLTSLAGPGEKPEYSLQIAATLRLKALVLLAMGDFDSALALAQQAVRKIELAFDGQVPEPYLNRLVKCVSVECAIRRARGEQGAFLELTDRMLELSRRHVMESDDVEGPPRIARLLMNKAVVLRDLGRLPEALMCLDDGIELLEHKLRTRGKLLALGSDLAQCYLNKGNMLENAQCYGQAKELLEKSVSLFDRLVVQYDRRELLPIRINAEYNLGVVLTNLDDGTSGLLRIERAVSMIREFVAAGGTEHRGILGIMLLTLSHGLKRRGDEATARVAAGEGYRILQQEVALSPNPDYVRGIEWADKHLADLLPRGNSSDGAVEIFSTPGQTRT